MSIFSAIQNFFNGSAIGALNNNFTTVEAELTKRLRRDGTAPMSGNLDMNSHRIINAMSAISDNEVATLGDMRTLISTLNGGSISLPFQKREFVATAGQTAFAFLTAPLAGYTSVYVNGVKVPSSDFTVAGSTITLNDALTGGENVTIEGFIAGRVADASAITYGSGAVADKLALLSSADGVSFIQSGVGSVTRTVRDKGRETISVLDFGAKGDGTTDDAAAINAALTAGAGGKVFLPRSANPYLCRSQIVVPDFTALVLDGWGCVLKKGFNGDLVSLGRQSFIDHGVIDGNKASYTGNGVTISVGANTPTISLQGHQRVSRMFFQNVAGYPVIYPTANLGWMSVVEKCAFQGTGGIAAVCWPDEAAVGGNRKVRDCYSDVPIVNLNGCDNGVITGCTTGGSATTNQGIYCPAGTTNRAKKVIIAGNRFAIGGGSIDFRGFDCQFSDNIIAGDVHFLSNASSDGAATTFFGSSNILTGTLTDSSLTPNNIQIAKEVAFTPTITASGGGFAMGNADVRCEYTRNGDKIVAKYAITFGTTTTFGSGYWTLSLPVNRYVAITTDFVGSALAQNQSCGAQTLFGSGTDGFYILTSGGSPVGASVPSAWASGNKLFVSIEYRIY